MVKISDFGLARDVKDTEYFRSDYGNKEIPIRWISIKAMQYSMFTTQSDVVGCMLEIKEY